MQKTAILDEPRWLFLSYFGLCNTFKRKNGRFIRKIYDFIRKKRNLFAKINSLFANGEFLHFFCAKTKTPAKSAGVL